MRSALIIGSQGQDGRIASEYLTSLGYMVYALGRDAMITRQGLPWGFDIVSVNDSAAIAEVLKIIRPDEIYYFAAFNQSSEDNELTTVELFRRSEAVHVTGLLNTLEGIRKTSIDARLVYASSSLIFEDSDAEMQSEETQFSPLSIYGITKLSGLLLCRYYRKQYGIPASTAILYNHESEYRGDNYLSMKLIKGAIEIKQGKRNELVLGDLSARVDWGYARDYVEAMHCIVNCKEPDEYIVASGQLHTVGQFSEIVFSYLELDYRDYVVEDCSILTRRRRPLSGNVARLRQRTGWQSRTDFSEMLKKITAIKLVELS